MPLWRDANRLLLLIEDAVRKFPRYHKYTLGSDLRKQAMNICRLIARAVHDREGRAQHLKRLVFSIDDMKVLIQLGRVFVCAASDIALLPMVVQKGMKTGKPVTGLDAMHFAPLTALKGVRAQLRHAGLAHLFVAEEGYLPQGSLSAASGIHLVRGGMKRRVLRLLWQPGLN